ncbi:MAG: hypothetical protein V4709_06185 [Pseudomonadota bacterium]
MLVKKLTALIVVASAITVAGCNDNNSPQMTPIVTTPTPAPVPTPGPTPTPVPVPTPVTVSSFAVDQVKTVTCSFTSSTSINDTTFADSEAAVDVQALAPGCMGGIPN